MDHNEQLDQLDRIKANMLRHMDLFNAALQHNSEVAGGATDAKAAEQHLEKMDALLLRQDEQLLLADKRRNATLRLMILQSENLTAALRALERRNGRP